MLFLSFGPDIAYRADFSLKINSSFYFSFSFNLNKIISVALFPAQRAQRAYLHTCTNINYIY